MKQLSKKQLLDLKNNKKTVVSIAILTGISSDQIRKLYKEAGIQPYQKKGRDKVLYQIENCDGYFVDEEGTIFKNGIILEPKKQDGEKVVVVYNNNRDKKLLKVSNVVYKHFVGALEDGEEVKFIDGNHSNCNASNLFKIKSVNVKTTLLTNQQIKDIMKMMFYELEKVAKKKLEKGENAYRIETLVKTFEVSITFNNGFKIIEISKRGSSAPKYERTVVHLDKRAYQDIYNYLKYNFGYSTTPQRVLMERFNIRVTDELRAFMDTKTFALTNFDRFEKLAIQVGISKSGFRDWVCKVNKYGYCHFDLIKNRTGNYTIECLVDGNGLPLCGYMLKYR